MLVGLCKIDHLRQVRQFLDVSTIADDVLQLAISKPGRFCRRPTGPVVHPAVDFTAFHGLVDLRATLIAFDDLEFRAGDMVHQRRGEIGL